MSAIWYQPKYVKTDFGRSSSVATTPCLTPPQSPVSYWTEVTTKNNLPWRSWSEFVMMLRSDNNATNIFCTVLIRVISSVPSWCKFYKVTTSLPTLRFERGDSKCPTFWSKLSGFSSSIWTLQRQNMYIWKYKTVAVYRNRKWSAENRIKLIENLSWKWSSTDP